MMEHTCARRHMWAFFISNRWTVGRKLFQQLFELKNSQQISSCLSSKIPRTMQRVMGAGFTCTDTNCPQTGIQATCSCLLMVWGLLAGLRGLSAMGAVISLHVGAGWLAGWLAGWPAGRLASSESPRTSQAINLYLVMQLLIEECHVKPQDYKNSCSEFGKVSLSCEGTLKQQTVLSGVYFLPQGSGDDFSANF